MSMTQEEKNEREDYTRRKRHLRCQILGVPKMLLLGLQHMFAMFGATILVPMLTGLDVSTTLLFAGLGTLLFHLLTKRKVPAFLGSSFAFLGGYAAIALWQTERTIPHCFLMPASAWPAQVCCIWYYPC